MINEEALLLLKCCNVEVTDIVMDVTSDSEMSFLVLTVLFNWRDRSAHAKKEKAWEGDRFSKICKFGHTCLDSHLVSDDLVSEDWCVSVHSLGCPLI